VRYRKPTNSKTGKLMKWVVSLLAITTLISGSATSVSAAETSCDPTQSTILINCDFTGADLSGRSFVGYVIANSKFNGANLGNTDFSGVNLSENQFSYGPGKSATSYAVSLRQDQGPAQQTIYATSGVILSANLRYESISNPSCGGSITPTGLGTPVVTVNLSSLPDTCVGQIKRLVGFLTGSESSNTNFTNSNLSSANLSGADLSGVVLTGANVTNTDFSGAVLEGVVTGSLGGAPLVLPERWHLMRGYLVGPKASLVGAQLNNLDMSFWDFSGANLTSVNFYQSTLYNASFVGSKALNINLDRTNLTGANFTDADLTGAILNWARISVTNFTRAKLINVTRGCYDAWVCDWSGYPEFAFSGAILTGVKSWNFAPNYRFNAFLPAGWTNRYGVLFGPTADLSGLSLRQLDLTNLNLSNANLTGVDLSGSNLSGSDLSNAVLTGVISGAVTGTPTLPAGWSLLNGYLVGPGAKLANASLAKANLFGLDLSGVDFTNTNLAGANLWGANLTNTNLINANLEGIDMTGATVQGANFTGASMETLIGVDLVGVAAALPTGWSIQNGKFGRSITLFGIGISGTPEVGKTLTVTPTTSPSGASLSYQWFRDSVEMVGETSSQHLVTLADIGSMITVRVTASKADYWSVTQDSTAMFVPVTFNALTRVQMTGNNTLGSVISLSSSGKSSISVLKYQVSRDGGQTWVNLTGSTHQLSFEDLGLNLQFRAHQSAEGYQTQITSVGTMTASNSVSLPGYSAGSLDVANSFGSLGVMNTPGTRLSAIKTQWSPNVRVSGFWLSSEGGAVSTKSLYTISLADVGSTFRYVEVGVAPGGSVSYRISSPLAAKANTFDNSNSPKISGTLVIGSKLKASLESNWAPGVKYSYQWLMNGEAIPGERTASYTLGLNQVGNDVNVRVCGSKTGYETKCEISQQGGLVAKGTLVSTTSPVITTTSVKVGTLVKANTGKWSAGAAFTFKWLRDGIEIAGATQVTYLVTKDDSRHNLSLQVTASKAGYSDLTKVSAPKSVN